jgi:hypothetical protein
MKVIKDQQGSIVTIDTYRRFQQWHNTEISHDTFVGLCSYLYIILRWGYQIPPTAFDASTTNGIEGFVRNC